MENSLRKNAYSYILKILPPKNENCQITNSDIFPISPQNIDCGYSLETPQRGGSNEYPQSMFLSRNRINTRVCYLTIFIFLSGKMKTNYLRMSSATTEWPFKDKSA